MLCLVLLLRPVLEMILNARFEPLLVFYIVAAALVPKFGNYALVSYMMATGQIRTRLVLTVVVGAVAVVGSFVASTMGVVELAVITPASELLLTALIGAVFIRAGRRTDQL